MATNTEGRISEWNEATLKVIRLHEIQDAINNFKMNPLGITQGRFNYEWFAKNVEALYGEGYSKYDSKERKKCDEVRKLVFWALENQPPCYFNKDESVVEESKSFIVDKDRLNNFMELLEIYVRLVKDYNDKHGLTTKNKKSGGLF